MILKPITENELKIILENHNLWLKNSADGKKADLSSANLRYANLISANLRFADLSYADLSFADLISADLISANLSSADLISANLSFADLSSANLSSANLSSANLRFADLSSANLSFANLSSADLIAANLDKRYIQVICIGKQKGITTYCFDDDIIWCGCWTGNLKDFKMYVEETHKNNKQYLNEYLNFIKYLESLKVEEEIK